jgi:hypothetical protein
MVAEILPKITAFDAQATANGFLLDHLPDRFCTDEPHFDDNEKLWRLTVVLAYPFIGPVGKVGEIAVSAYEEKVVSHTPFDEMKSRALQIYEQRRADIEAAFI